MVGRHDPGGAGDVAVSASAFEAVRVDADELSNMIDPHPIVRMQREIALEQVEKGVAMHRTASRIIAGRRNAPENEINNHYLSQFVSQIKYLR